jgi:multidrug efflux system membrane fusion protein
LKFGIGAILLVIIAILLTTYFFGRPHARQAPVEQAVAITTGQATSGNMNVYLDALGTVTPVNTVTVYSQVTGRIVAVSYQQGQIVRAGDPLVEIDPRPYQALLTQAEGTLQRDLELLAEAQMDLNRYRAAYARNAIAEQLLADQEKTVAQDEGLVRADRGTVSYDETQLSYCHIVAPIGGRVGLRLVDPGNEVFAGSGSVLVVITQLQPITVVFSVPEGNVTEVQAELRRHGPMAVDLFGSSDQRPLATGTLSSVDNLVDTTTGTVRFRATFANRDFALFPNQFVNVRLHFKTLRRVTLVPAAAVQYNGTNSFVYVVQPNHTVKVEPVTVLTANDRETAVTGIAPGTTVATTGFDRLENGVPVRTQNPSQASGARPTR